MIGYTKRELNLLALLIALLIILICNLLIFPIKNLNSTNLSYKKVYSKTIPISKITNFNTTKTFDNILNIQQINYEQTSTKEEIQEKSKETNNKTKNETNSNTNNEINNESNNNKQTETQREVVNENKSNKWRIQIPKINLDVHILEGTTSDILLKAVGHFEETSKWNGNVGLAAHNRGYNCNFFQNIKKLKIGDEIIYYTNNKKKVYKVQMNKVILDTDWNYLKQTNDNRITLITCEENRPNYRRCIQAIEIANYNI